MPKIKITLSEILLRRRELQNKLNNLPKSSPVWGDEYDDISNKIRACDVVTQRTNATTEVEIDENVME